MTHEFWKGRKVFVLGHTGFLGSWLSLALQNAGSQVAGLALSPTGKTSLFDVFDLGSSMSSVYSDIRDESSLRAALEFSEPEIVFNLINASRDDRGQSPKEIFEVQNAAALNLLECLRSTVSIRAAVFLSSDKVYRSEKDPSAVYAEESPLAGNSPAVAAKASAEIIFQSYLNTFFQPEKYNKHKVALATARMGSLIGGGDFASDSLLKQALEALFFEQKLELKNPASVRPWMHVFDAVHGLMRLAEALIERGPKASGAWNFGVEDSNYQSVAELITQLESLWQGKGLMPQGVLSSEVASGKSFHGRITSEKARQQLGWQQRWDLPKALKQSVEWQKAFAGGKVNMREFSLAQLASRSNRLG